MPAIDTSGLPSETASAVKSAHDEVKSEKPLLEERYVGSVPVHIDKGNVPYAGVTEFGPYDGKAKRVGINGRVDKNYAKRVAAHELRHVKSEPLLKYSKGVDQKVVTLIMESYAEYAGIKDAKEKGKPYKENEIRKTSPYPQAIAFAEYVEKVYVSNHTNEKGYLAFINDIVRNKSMAKTLNSLVYQSQRSRAVN